MYTDGVHGPRTRADDVIHVRSDRQSVGECNAEYFKRRHTRGTMQRRRRVGATSLPVVAENEMTSTDFAWFNARLLARDQSSTLEISLSRLSTLQAGIR